MNSQASFTLRSRNPDVLTCIANLSNDEVFTPPEFASRILDTLTEAWAASHGGATPLEDIKADVPGVQQALIALQEKKLAWRAARGIYAVEERAVVELLRADGLLAGLE